MSFWKLTKGLATGFRSLSGPAPPLLPAAQATRSSARVLELNPRVSIRLTDVEGGVRPDGPYQPLPACVS